jgi:hypothetical protein
VNAIERIDDDPVTAGIHRDVMDVVARLGEHEVSVGATTVRLKRARTFLEIHPRQSGLLLNLVLDIRLISGRVRKAEPVSAQRWHNHVMLRSGGDVDGELMGWIEDAYELAD